MMASFIADKTTCSGSLKKEGAVRKNWKERWFEFDLKTRTIRYFANGTKQVNSTCLLALLSLSLIP